MRKRTLEVARLAAEKGYRLQRERPLSGDFWLWGRVHTHVPLVVGSLRSIESFFALDEMHQMEMEANTSFAMMEGLAALAELHGPHAVAELSVPAYEVGASIDEHVRAQTVVDDRPWRVQDGGNAVEGFHVVGYDPFTTDPVLRSIPDLFGPYATLEYAEAVVAARDATVRPPKHVPEQRTEKPDRHAAIVTPETLVSLVRTGQEQSLNRRADLRVSEGRTFVEQAWNTGIVSFEIRADCEYALVPTRLHLHRAGQEIDPHWRCDLYVRGGNGYERKQIVLDVFIRDFDQLPELTDG